MALWLRTPCHRLDEVGEVCVTVIFAASRSRMASLRRDEIFIISCNIEHSVVVFYDTITVKWTQAVMVTSVPSTSIAQA